MKSFTYRFEGQLRQSLMDSYSIGDKIVYRVRVDDAFFLIFKSGGTKSGDFVTWHQEPHIKDQIFPADLIQALGDGLTRAGLVKKGIDI